ncbi:SdpI family protein [Spirosoma aerophilum]
MKTNSTSIEFLIVACMLAPMIYLAIVWNQLPDQLPVHYDMQGSPNGWQMKETAALSMGCLTGFMYLILRFVTRLTPNGTLQTGNYQKLRLVVGLFWGITIGLVFYMAGHQGADLPVIRILMGLVGFLFAGLGNYLTTVKPNWFVGIRTPWTLANETVWRKTHRLAGRLMVAGGLASMVLAFVLPSAYLISCILGLAGLVAIIPTVYSYIFFRQEKSHQLN